MTVLAGTVWGDLRTSHLYAIFKGNYVYFGETGHVPPVRWKSHLTSQTDFIGKLAAEDPVEAAKGAPIFFVGVHIGMCDSEPELRQKIARRAIEAELHRRFAISPHLVAPAMHLLSSSPASPVSHKFGFDKVAVAMSVYEMIAAEYRSWLKMIDAKNSTPPVPNVKDGAAPTTNYL
jgi:hypothetical protein